MNDIEEIIKRANDYENSETWDRSVTDKYADAASDDVRYLVAYIEKREKIHGENWAALQAAIRQIEDQAALEVRLAQMQVQRDAACALIYTLKFVTDNSFTSETASLPEIDRARMALADVRRQCSDFLDSNY